MAQPVIQTAFHSGEWAPALAARVDVAKYHSACALGLNYYVDYRGGLSTRMGTTFIIPAYKPDTPVRLIPFQASTAVGYVLEFGDEYIRFINNGSPVFDINAGISAATNANPLVVTVNTGSWIVDQWIYVTGAAGMTEINGRYYKISAVAGLNLTLADVDGTPINSTTWGVYSPNTASGRRVYTISSPYAANDLALLKFTQNVDQLVICHPNYAPRILRLISATNWTLTTIQFGSQVAAPTGISVATTLGAGTVNYSYTVTAVDANGQESAAGTAAALANRTDLRTVAGTNRITWNAVSGAVRYNVYKSELSYTNAVASGAAHGYIGFTTSATFDDSNIAPDFTEAPPLAKNPFQGSGVESIAVTVNGTYTTPPTVTLGAPPAGGVQATAQAVLQVTSFSPDAAPSSANWVSGDIAYFFNAGVWIGVAAVVDGVIGGNIATFHPVTFPGSILGSITSGTAPTTNLAVFSTPAFGVGKVAQGDLTWGVGIVNVLNPGAGYTSAPAVTFSAGAAAATASLEDVLGGNPFVPQFAFQRLGLLGQSSSPQQFNLSRPGLFTNFDVSDPAQPDDAIEGTLVSGQLNEIKSAIPMPSGLIIFSDKAAWLLFGTQPGQAATAIDATAQPQAYVGANDVPPIIANDNILYVQANGSSVRNLNYNFYANVYTGTDISILSSHLFFNKNVLEWTWAEEPFKLAWAIRSDGILLSLTFVKEQELIGWCHSDTQGSWKSVASIVEQLDNMKVNAVYLAAERTVGGVTTQYIERMADRVFADHTECFCVDAGVEYDSVPATSFFAYYLRGKDVVGLRDGTPFTATVSATGTFILPSSSHVIVGLRYIPDFQTLALDTGNPTIQAKMKKITGPTLRVQETLGLQIGQSFDASSLVDIDDLVIGNVGTMTNEVVAGLVTGDVRQNIDPDWTETGQFCVRQPLPYPATILGVIPELTVGDTEK